MTLTQKAQRALFRQLAIAALAVEARLDGDPPSYMQTRSWEVYWKALDDALREVSNTTFAKRLPSLKRNWE